MHEGLNCSGGVGGGVGGLMGGVFVSASGGGVELLSNGESPIRRSAKGTIAQWTCKICEKTFAQNSNYKNHIRTHTNDRP